MTVIHMTDLADVANNDGNMTSLVDWYLNAKEVPKYAGAWLANMMSNDYSDEQLAAFADPGSVQKEEKDGHGNKVTGNRLPGFIWDRYTRKDGVTGEEIKGQWYADWFGRTTSGRAIVAVLDDIDKAKNNAEDAPDKYKNMGEKALADERAKYAARFTAACNLYRQSIKIIRQWDTLMDMFGTDKTDGEGNITKRATIAITWVLANPDHPEEGLAATLKPIRIIRLNTTTGERTEVYRDMYLSDFLNLNPDGALAKGGEYLHVVETKRVKIQPTPKGGKGQTAGQTAIEGKVTTANVLPILANMREFIESQSMQGAYMAQLANMKDEEKRHTYLEMGRIRRWLNSQLDSNAGYGNKLYLEEEKRLRKVIESEQAAKDAVA